MREGDLVNSGSEPWDQSRRSKFVVGSVDGGSVRLWFRRTGFRRVPVRATVPMVLVRFAAIVRRPAKNLDMGPSRLSGSTWENQHK